MNTVKGITHCYICNVEKPDTFKNLMEFRTYYTNNAVVDKISMLMGNNFAIILTENDIICSNCMQIFNAIDKLELELEQGRVILINNLAKTYHLNFNELDNVASCINNKFYDKYFCSVCNFSTSFVEEYFQHIISFDCSNQKLKIVSDIQTDTNETYNCILCEFNTINKNYFIKHSKTHVDPNHVCLQCLKTLYNYHELQKHIKEHPMFNCRICGHPFSNYTKLKCHLLKCSRSDQFKTYKCSICKIDFFNYVPYRKHITSKHGKKFPKLSIIDENIESNPQSIEQNETENLLNDLLYFENNKSLKIEVNHEDTSDLIGILENLSPQQLENEKKFDGETTASKELKTVYICAICSFETPLDTEMKLHISSHVKDEYKCDRCNSTFKTAHTLELHARKHLDGAQPVKCGICGCECIDKLHLRSHKKNVHKIHLTCNVCKTVCRTKKELQIHYQKHSGNGKLECDICKQTFSREIMYKCHKEYSHRLDNNCKFCHKELSNLKELRMHEKRHKRQGNFDLKCPYCEKTLKTKTGLRVHLAKHTGEYKFFCEVCGRGCMSLMVLQEHMGVHTKEERYVCDVCGKKFCYNATYRIHRLWHDNPKPYDCADCGQKFAHTSLLAVHRRREHTGERPYVCFDCNMTFTRSSSLKRHNRIHTGERPYVCVWCNKGFIEKKLWVKHLVNEHDDYSEVNNKQKCEYKMVIRPETDETTEIGKENTSNQTHEEMQEFIIIGNPSMENMIFYGLPQQVIDEPKGIEMDDTHHSSAILLPSEEGDVGKSDEQQTEVKFTVADGYQIIQDDIKSEHRLLEGVDEANIVIKTENGDMVIRNGQLVPLTDAY